MNSERLGFTLKRQEESKGRLVLMSASLMSAVLGSVHAFSIFLQPLEIQFAVGRSTISLIYSGALICLTLAVLFGHRIYARVSAAVFVSLTAMLGALGVAIAGVASDLAFVWLGYCVFFGIANGLGYGFGLQIAAQFNPGREGAAMGVVTAAYALGAVLSPILFENALELGGFRLAMTGLAACLIGVGALSAFAMASAGARFANSRADIQESGEIRQSDPSILLLWLIYFGGVMAGLMVIGHAAGIAAETTNAGDVWLAPALLAGCNLVGSLVGGRLADRFPARSVLALLTGLTVLTLLALSGDLQFAGVLACLGLIGFAYGGTIAAHPAYIAKHFGSENGPWVYGRVFTAWGTAGLAGPWLAGSLYDASGTYVYATLIAACFGGVSIAVTWLVFRPS